MWTNNVAIHYQCGPKDLLVGISLSSDSKIECNHNEKEAYLVCTSVIRLQLMCLFQTELERIQLPHLPAICLSQSSDKEGPAVPEAAGAGMASSSNQLVNVEGAQLVAAVDQTVKRKGKPIIVGVAKVQRK